METSTLPQVPIHNGQTAVPVTLPVVKKRKWLMWLISVVLLFTTIVLALHGYIAWTLARPHIDPLKSNPLAAINLPYENVTFLGQGGTTPLQGWYIPSALPESKQTVIFSHGYGGNREEIWVPIYDLAKELHRQNYNVLMFDYGYVQEESPRIVSGGIHESKELLGAVNYIKARGTEKVFIWGFSMGGGTALQAALQTDQIDGMILDSAFLLEPDTLYHNLKQFINLPKFPSLPLVRLFFPILNGVSMQQIPYSKVKQHEYSIPIFFIHGEKDQKAPYEIIQSISKNQKMNVNNLWLLPNDDHEQIYKAHKQQYLRKTMAFLSDLSHKSNLQAQ